MTHHKHLTIIEREKIMILSSQGTSISDIARLIGRNKSTISRELRRNTEENVYSASSAQLAYNKSL